MQRHREDGDAVSAKKNIDWDAVDGIDDPRVSLREIARRVGCSHAAVEQARGKRSRLEEENANLRRLLVEVREAYEECDNVDCSERLENALHAVQEVLRG